MPTPPAPGPRAQRSQEGSITAADYTLQCKGLPPDITEAEVMAHFDQQIRAQMQIEMRKSPLARYDLKEKVVENVSIAKNQATFIHMYALVFSKRNSLIPHTLQ